MSVAVSAVCWRVQLPAGEKLVLLCLADFADDDGTCWPGIEVLAERTGLTERSVRSHLKRLEDCALLERQRRVGQSAVYRISVAPEASGLPDEPAQTPEPEQEIIPSDRKNLPVEVEKISGSSGKNFRFNRKNLPVQPEKISGSYRSITDPSLIHQGTTKRAGARDPVPVWVDPDAWSAFVESRRAQRAPFTARAAELILAKLAALRDSGHDPNACLLQSVERGWRGVFPVKPGGLHETNFRSGRRLSAVERVAAACAEWEAGLGILEADGGDVRPPLDERPGRNAECNVVEGHFRLTAR